MMRNYTLLFLIPLIVFGCGLGSDNKGDWVKKPLKDWPDIALTNEVSFDTKTFTDLASGFLVDNGKDTLAVTSKQLFMVFVQLELTTVDFKGKLKDWVMYPRDNPKSRVILDKLINVDPNEFTAMPGSTYSTDWLIFSIKENTTKIQPLKIATQALNKGQVLYVVGWPDNKTNSEPEIIAGSVFRLFDNQIFMEMQSEIKNPEGYMGSPVFNENGEVVGIYSNTNESIGRSCTVTYLTDILSDYNMQ